MFDCFPCDEEANDIEPIALDPGKMGVCIVEREWPSNEADGVGVFEKAVGDVRRDVGAGRLLRVAADVQAAQCQHPAQPISLYYFGDGDWRLVACLPLLSLKWMPSTCTARGGSISLIRRAPFLRTSHRSPCVLRPFGRCFLSLFRPPTNIYRALYFCNHIAHIYFYFASRSAPGS